MHYFLPIWEDLTSYLHDIGNFRREKCICDLREVLIPQSYCLEKAIGIADGQDPLLAASRPAHRKKKSQ